MVREGPKPSAHSSNEWLLILEGFKNKEEAKTALKDGLGIEKGKDLLKFNICHSDSTISKGLTKTWHNVRLKTIV